MQTKMTDKHKLMAWILNKEFKYTMVGIAQLMHVSQSTISLAVKEVEYWRTIKNLNDELSEARQIIANYGILPPSNPTLYLNEYEEND